MVPVHATISLDALVEQIRAVECRGVGVQSDAAEVLATGWKPVDAALGGGVAWGAIHEWLGGEAPTRPKKRRGARAKPGATPSPGPDPWVPPVTIALHLARAALEAATPDTTAKAANGGVVVWVGRRCWPYAPVLAAGDAADPGPVFARNLFVDAPNDAERLWAIDTALRSPGVIAVVADASGFDMPATRRLQLAAEAGRRAAAGAGFGPAGLGLMLRPLGEARELSAAATRWEVRPAPVAPPEHARPDTAADDAAPRWALTLRRIKGVVRGAAVGGHQARSGVRGGTAAEAAGGPARAAATDVDGAWLVELDRATGRLRVPPDVAGGPRQTTGRAPPQRQHQPRLAASG